MKLRFNDMTKERAIAIEEYWFAMPPKRTGALESENNVEVF
jgi:hypothetical protein